MRDVENDRCKMYLVGLVSCDLMDEQNMNFVSCLTSLVRRWTELQKFRDLDSKIRRPDARHASLGAEEMHTAREEKLMGAARLLSRRKVNF